jgi:hypothetical protein
MTWGLSMSETVGNEGSTISLTASGQQLFHRGLISLASQFQIHQQTILYVKNKQCI